jgi:hypothetical protein
MSYEHEHPQECPSGYECRNEIALLVWKRRAEDAERRLSEYAERCDRQARTIDDLSAGIDRLKDKIAELEK